MTKTKTKPRLTIKHLEALISKNHKQRHMLMDQLDDLKNKKVLPSLKKKYEGKYFKYDNGYSSDKRWPVYSYCYEIKSEYEAIVDTFQFIPDEGWRFSINSPEGLHLLQKEITEKEFDREAIQLASAARTLISLKD